MTQTNIDIKDLGLLQTVNNEDRFLMTQQSTEHTAAALTVAKLKEFIINGAGNSNAITGITKAMVENVLTGSITTHTHPWSKITGVPTTVAGYGITDVYKKGDSDTRYIQKSGDTMTGALSSNTTITGSRLISSIATGTAPLTIASTTVVPNLNADMLDGLHSTDLTRKYFASDIYADYNWIVIGLINLTDRKTSGDYSSGHILNNRKNGIYNGGLITFNYQTIYNTNNCYLGYTVTGTSNLTPCTFTYNGKKFAGFFWKGSSSLNNITISMIKSIQEPFFVRYYNSNTQNILNKEIHDSLVIGGSDISIVQSSYHGNATSATTLLNSRSLWGQSFNGSANISGNMSGVGSITMNGAINGATTISASSGINGTNIRATNGLLYSTANGHEVQIGSMNSSWCHIYSSAPTFVFNKPIAVMGSIYPYASNSYTLGTSTNRWSNFYTQLLNVAGAATLSNTLSVAGVATFSNVTDTTSPTTGSVKVSGGLGVAKSIWAGGNIILNGEITAFNSSDIRLKTDLKNLSGLPLLRKTKTYTFNWTDEALSIKTDKHRNDEGFIAQEIEKIAPHFVTHNMWGKGYMGLDKTKFIPYLVAAVNELDDEVTLLKREICELRKEIKSLKKK